MSIEALEKLGFNGAILIAKPNPASVYRWKKLALKWSPGKGSLKKEVRALKVAQGEGVVEFRGYKTTPAGDCLLTTYYPFGGRRWMPLFQNTTDEGMRRALRVLKATIWRMWRAGVLHEDVMYKNIVFPTPEIREPRLIDFGRARRAHLPRPDLQARFLRGRAPRFAFPWGLLRGKDRFKFDIEGVIKEEWR